MANTVDEYDFDDKDDITSMKRKRLSTTVNITSSDYLNKNRQAVFSNVSSGDNDDEDTTKL